MRCGTRCGPRGGRRRATAAHAAACGGRARLQIWGRAWGGARPKHRSHVVGLADIPPADVL
eukprot:scaffold98742_cov36-Phaeocystis_antarctica.AAC.1